MIFVYLFFAANLFACMWIGLKDNKQINKQNIMMLVFSLVFYAWGGPKYLLVLLTEVFASWICGIQIEKAYDAGDMKTAKKFLIIDVVIMLGCLGFFKYLGFFLSTTKGLFGLIKNIPSIVLPIGISFYTFQLISYDVDVYWGKVYAQKSFWKLLLYAGLFHQCIAGPIIRYETVADEINDRKAGTNDMYQGIRRFSIGLAKKAVLANSCALAVKEFLPDGLENLQGKPWLAYVFGMIFFTLQIYFDFSAYSDMAIGMGRMIGFHYMENFNYPYMANTIQDFWRRWHISLSTFFRDYVYIPLGGSRVSTGKYVRNMLIVWGLTGFWHGASWNYLLWGLYFFVLLMFEKFVMKNQVVPFLSRAMALIGIVLGWVIFKYENTKELLTVFKGMFGIGAKGVSSLSVKTSILKYIFFLIFALIAATPLGKNLTARARKNSRNSEALFKAVNIVDMVLPVILLIIATLALAGDNYNPFLYFRF